jgi:hypothetical protein
LPIAYTNRLSARLDAELTEANELGIRGIEAPSAAFDALVALGQRLIYVVTTSYSVVVCERNVQLRVARHSVIAVGESVFAAGEVEVSWVDHLKLVIELTNTSGHYRPGAECLDLAAQAFRSLGFIVPDGAILPYTEA